MDRRLILALTLGVGVIFLSNWLFPPTTPTKAPSASAVADTSAAPASGTTTSAGQPATTLPSVVPAVGAAPTAAPATAPVAAETLSLATPRATYRFSTLGATMIGVTLREFRSLRVTGDSAPVELARRNEPMFRYSLVVPGDTISLTGVAFTPSRSTTAAADVVSFTTSVPTGTGPATVTFTYTLPTDTAMAYRATVQASVAGIAGNPYLLIGMPEGLEQTEADSADAASNLAFAWLKKGGDASILKFSDLDPGDVELEPGPHTWVVSKNKYFVVGALSTSEQSTPFAEVSFAAGARTQKFATAASATIVTELRAGNAAWELYTGPQEWKRLLAVGRDFENSNPYGGFLQGVVQPFATIVMRVLLWMKAATQLNYGWVLIIFGVAIRLAMWPLNQSAMRTSIRMQRISPELQAVQAKFKSDPQKLQAEMMKVYAAHGLSPFSTFSGCLPMLLPMPILFALFFVFQNTIEFRGVSFWWLPDISMKDPLYIVPLAMGLTMYLLSWIGMRNAPPNPQAKMMAYIFPVMMTFLFLNFASGLNLYYTVQNLAALPQQWLLANERGKEARRT
ncbi:MAG: YidC/Oxa1 family insertase periplasmic-domain containing protein [Gemmatimonadaceae bacterium]|nr:YidC/Oxa1 family insertase periplasmic-domain containing protein [Gemmatimonadaceae bacterium]